MKRFASKRILLVLAGLLLVSPVAFTQVKQILKLIGVGAAVKQFGPQINSAFNSLTKHKDTASVTTKVVPILTSGYKSRGGIGAAQVLGPKALVDTVQSVIQLEQDLFGKEVRIRALIPSSSTNPLDVDRVDGVAVSGIVDLKL